MSAPTPPPRRLTTHVSPETMTYDGTQLRSHFALRRFGIVGDAMVAFRGPCRVSPSEMVDLLDVAEGAAIAAREMLHVIWERFDDALEGAILRQHLLVATLVEEIGSLAPEVQLRRTGNDVHVGERKLSVSVATRSPVSCLIHLGINIDPSGAPVAAVGLDELGIDPRVLTGRLLARTSAEEEIVERSRVKVRPVP